MAPWLRHRRASRPSSPRRRQLLPLSFGRLFFSPLAHRSPSSQSPRRRRPRLRRRAAQRRRSPAPSRNICRRPWSSACRAIPPAEARRRAPTLTILFSDVRGFTTIAETLKDDPEQLTALITAADADDRRRAGHRRHHRQIYRRRHHGVLERAARRSRPCAARRRGGARDAGGARAAQRRAGARRRREPGRRRRAADRHRHQHRRLLRRQHGLDRASTTRCSATR